MNKHFPNSSKPVKLYGLPVSGHAHRAELMLAFLDVPYEKIDVDLMNGAHKAPDFLNLNLFGQIPVIDDNGDIVSDSNAILIYLTKKYDKEHAWLPEDPLAAAQVQRWLSVAANEVAAGPGAARLVKLFGLPLDYEVAKTKAANLFATMEPHLQSHEFLAGDTISIADVAGYTYISHAPEGGVSLEPYPAIRAWLARIEAQPRFVGMVRSPEPEAA
jgi:glutathione S-transferase